MKDKMSKEQLNKDIEQFQKDLKELSQKIEVIGKRDRVGKDMAPEVLNALLIEEPFILSPPLKDHYEIGEIQCIINHREKRAISTK